MAMEKEFFLGLFFSKRNDGQGHLQLKEKNIKHQNRVFALSKENDLSGVDL
jgi:hypothetical protein